MITATVEIRPTGGDVDGRRAWAPVDRVLGLFERGRLSATELRVLLALRGRRDASISGLGGGLAGRRADVRRAVRRLDMRGLVRQWHARRTEHSLLAITPAGLAPVPALLAEAGQPAAAPDAAKAPVR